MDGNLLILLATAAVISGQIFEDENLVFVPPVYENSEVIFVSKPFILCL